MWYWEEKIIMKMNCYKKICNGVSDLKKMNFTCVT